MPSNLEFISAIFGSDAPRCHVTDFVYDPSDIPKDRHLVSWVGDYFENYNFQEESNQYFTISTFDADEKGRARRRKALYLSTPCIVLDDVKEKLSMVEVSKLPAPSWIMETSPGSEQWGYILDTPATDRLQVENLLDGLVANGLAPQGRDPGMKGVTRYVRLPEGYNTKKAKMIDGKPFKCHMSLWSPFTTVTLEALAAPFNVDLTAERRESRVDGAAAISDHPLVNIPEIIEIKEVRSDGRFDIVCPWVEEHTGGADDGSAIFTNSDGSMGFKCHHGHCQERTGGDLLNYIEAKQFGFKSEYADWIVLRTFTSVESSVAGKSVSEDGSQEEESTPQNAPSIGTLTALPPSSIEARELASVLLKAAESRSVMDKLYHQSQISDHMCWTKTTLKEVLKGLRATWYVETKADLDYLKSAFFVEDLNKFYDYRKEIFYTLDALQNSYAHIDQDVRTTALIEGGAEKVDRLDYVPGESRTFLDGVSCVGNLYTECTEVGAPGDVSRWLNHFDVIGWAEHRDHILDWMAYTVQYPGEKINHILILGGHEGVGKDFLLAPLIAAMGRNAKVIGGEDLLDGNSDYLLATKYLHINEVEIFDHTDSRTIGNRIKPLAARPPETLVVKQKFIKPIYVQNLVNVTMTTNSETPLRLSGASRRLYPVWTDFSVRGEDGQMLQEWRDYWASAWDWILGEGSAACVNYLHTRDVSNFEPGQAPIVTEFLSEMQADSRSPLEQTFDALVDARIGPLADDLFSASDVCTWLRTSGSMAPGVVFCDTRNITPAVVGKVLGRTKGIYKAKATKCSRAPRLWSLDVSLMKMSTDDLIQKYENKDTPSFL